MHLYHIHREGNTDLACGYIGVSRDIRQRWQAHKRGETNTHLTNAYRKYNDIKEIVLVTGDKDYILDLEKKLRPASNMGWNIEIGGGVPPDGSGSKHTEATKQYLRQINKGAGNPNYGKARTEESKRKALATMKERGNQPNKGKFGKDNPLFGRKHSEESKALMSKNGKLRVYQQVTCPHCDKTGSSQAMGRWHFNNCRSKK